MYVRMYVCPYVCMYVYINIHIDIKRLGGDSATDPNSLNQVRVVVVN
jgi:hypothetical protein